MTITALDVGSTVEIGSGVAYFDPWDVNNNRSGEIDMGEPEEINLTIEQGDKTERRSRRSVGRPVIFTQTTQGSKSIKLTSLSVTAELKKLFLSAEKVTVTQTASAVTDEIIWTDSIEANRHYQLGQTTSNPVGVIGGTTVSIMSFPSGIAAWAADTAYAVGDAVEKVTDDNTVWAVVDAGTTDASEPAWPTEALGDTVVNGTVTFKRVSDAQETYVLGTDYELETNTDEGLRIKWISPDTFPHAIWANYTPTANTRTRLQTGSGTSLVGTFRFVEDSETPVFGKNWVAHKVELTPDGDLGLVTDESTLKQVSFTMNIQTVAGIPDLMVDGKAV